jgi:hypothetical protein
MTIAAQGKKTKQASNYRKGTLKAQCRMCKHFKAKTSSCSEVKGIIEANYLCDLFERKDT